MRGQGQRIQMRRSGRAKELRRHADLQPRCHALRRCAVTFKTQILKVRALWAGADAFLFSKLYID
ncbi:MAG: hypothetical protein BCS36_14200 [Desulfovibrio sp. MES5]|nr:MAG: hypothetical protein BCS36_14200 [Desulfovibrio sp. MES5]